MAVSSDLKFVLLEILQTPALMARGRELRIQNHLEMVHECIWALNSVIVDAQMRALQEAEVEAWVKDVGIAVADVEDLLRSILGWQPRGAAAAFNLLPCSFPRVDGVISRHDVLLELEEKARRLNYLVRRGSSICLRKEMMDSTYPPREEEEEKKKEYFILREAVVGRDGEVEDIIDEIRRKQLRRSNNVHDDDAEDAADDDYAAAADDDAADDDYAAAAADDDDDAAAADDDDDAADDDYAAAADDDAEDDAGLLWFTLVGPFMVGKTSIARMVYHHPWVCQNFDRRVWIDGSKVSSFGSMWVIKEFTRSIAGEPCEDVWLFYDRFGGSHTFFLIIDDFHLTGLGDQDKWNQLEHFLLLMGEPGSSVMLFVDFNFDYYYYYYYLDWRRNFSTCRVDTISEDNWAKLFMRHALSHPPDQAGEQEESMLLSFAHEFYNSFYFICLPVFAKVLGSTFKYTEMRPWQFDSLFSRMQIEQDQHFQLMLLHYLSPIFARQCLYESLIPQDHISDHADLLHVLAAEGIPRTTMPSSILTPGLKSWISNALERCYFQMRVGRDSTIPQQCLHLCLLVGSDASSFPTTLSAKANNKLRTLSLHREEEMVLQQQPCQITGIPAAMFANLVHLRILHLGATRIRQLPHTVGRLLNLRYLNLSQSEIRSLPASLCNLWSLQVLNLAWCEKLQKLPGRINNLTSLQILKLSFCARLQRLPKSITGLVNLQELDLEGCHGLVELPEDLGNMKKLTNLNMIKCLHSSTQMRSGSEQMHNLQKLSGYSICTVGSIGDAISELQPLTGLEELDLRNLQVVSNSTDASTPPPMLLQDILPKLKCLALHWNWHNMDDVDKASDVISLQVLEGLQPSIYLRELAITSYAGKEFPRWMKEAAHFVRNLKEIRLVNLRRCERLPPLGQLPLIRIIEISGMDSITVVDETFHATAKTQLLSLDKLIFSEMPRLEKLAEKEGTRTGDLVITELTLMQCPRLSTWEWNMVVQQLNIWLNNKMLWHCRSPDWQGLIGGIHELTIVGCEELRCLPQVLRSNQWVSQLTIISCSKLISLPDWLLEMEGLESLFISRCTELSYIPLQLETRPHLRLQLRGCPKLWL